MNCYRDLASSMTGTVILQGGRSNTLTPWFDSTSRPFPALLGCTQVGHIFYVLVYLSPGCLLLPMGWELTNRASLHLSRCCHCEHSFILLIKIEQGYGCLSSFLLAVTNTLTNATLKGEEVYSQPEFKVTATAVGAWGSWSHGIHSQDAERGVRVLSFTAQF